MPMSISYSVRREDFPPNLNEFSIQHLTLYFSPQGEEPFSEEVVLTHNQPATGTPAYNVLTSRGQSGINLKKLQGEPFGDWQLSFSKPEKVANIFKQGKVVDIFFVITYAAETPDWPA